VHDSLKLLLLDENGRVVRSSTFLFCRVEIQRNLCFNGMSHVENRIYPPLCHLPRLALDLVRVLRLVAVEELGELIPLTQRRMALNELNKLFESEASIFVE
jgi:hypothetical protein